jgi:O-antigen/teichoic acid export membrane protein
VTARERFRLGQPRPDSGALSESGLKADPLGTGAASSGPLLRNVLANWGGEVTRVISGFFVPRLIDQRMSREELGIWDYGWSMRSYVALAAAGLGSGGGHYAARYQDRLPELTRALGAMLALVIYGSVCAVLLTVGLAYLTPHLVNTESTSLLADARSLVLSTGVAASIAMPTMVFGGVIVGSRRFDVLNLIDAASDVLMVAGVLWCVLLGAGLSVMGLCVLARELVNGAAKYWWAGRLVPGLRIRPRWSDWTTFSEIAGFSAKTLVEAVSKLLQYQVGVLVVATVLGPAALALYSRPRALILITTRFVMGFARVLVPTASALHDRHVPKARGELLIRSTRYGLFLALPPALLMLIMGDAILLVWMGDRSYADSNVLPILVVGYLPLFAQQPTYHILVGLASHGLAGMASLIGSIVGAIMSILFVGVFGWGIEGAALATALPVFLVNLLVLPYAGCKAARLPLLRYLRESLPSPLLSVAPFAIALLVARAWLPHDATAQLLGGLLAGLPTLALVYWFTAVPDQLKTRILRRWPGLA